MSDNKVERLYEIGFQILAVWVRTGGVLTYKLTPDDENSKARMKAGAALYAFVCGDDVLYIGKTTNTLTQRFAGYKNPSANQATNIKCHRNIVECLNQGKDVEILTLSGVCQLRWGEFELNIAAGLEDSLIEELKPTWNGGNKTGLVLTESQMLEKEAVQDAEPRPVVRPEGSLAGLPKFSFRLGEKYYSDGFINPGVDVSNLIGKDRETMLLRLGAGDAQIVETFIDRKANKTGSPRLYGRKQTARWFQEHFRLGDTVEAVIINPNEIVLTLPAS